MADLKERLEAVCRRLGLEEKRKRFKSLGEEMGEPDFWRDRRRAQDLMREFKSLREEIEAVDDLRAGLAKLEKGGEGEAAAAGRKIEEDLRRLEVRTYLSGPYDARDALLSIHAGQGGVEAMDWTARLKRMYRRFSEGRGWDFEVLDEMPGEEAGLKSTVVEVKGSYAYGLLRGEKGVHRLVRQSPFNADHLRQTSFAMVEVIPLWDEKTPAVISPEEIEMETFRSSGHGGQNVQKVETAVRLRHRPTGVVVTCQAERSQAQNRRRALRLLQSKLELLEREKQKRRREELKGEHKVPGWGNQIRSYILHPYKLVKDLRTGAQSKSPEAVLDGDLDLFIEAELKMGL